MHRQERWSILLLCLILLPAVLLPAAHTQDKSTSTKLTPREQRFFNTAVLYVMQLMEKGMDRTRWFSSIRFPT
jgi:hypothetical protein